MRSTTFMRVGALAVALACSSFAVQAQVTLASERERRAEELREQRRRAEAENARRALTEPPWIHEELAKPPPPARKLTAEHKLRLYPSPEERQKFATFLIQPHTGLIHLLQSAECEDDPRVVHPEKSCLDAVPPVPGGGAYYSFAKRSHQLRQLSDLWLQGDAFRSGFAGSVLGVMTMLGDVPLESVRSESPGVDYLSTLAPPRSLAEARTQYRQNTSGFRVLGQSYGTTLPVRYGATYLLRSTNYKFGDALDEKRKLDDLLIVFRVVGATADGGVTLLWKELKRQKTPKIKK